MSDKINIGGITVSKFYLGGSSDVKIYLGTTKLYPHLQEPCFAVVDNISTYTARTYVDVYETSSDKWYKLNNLSAYEEYGIYGSGRTITYYEGKLTIDGDYEYQYSGNSWVNVGEVSGSTATLPDVPFTLNYNAKKYDASTHVITKTSGQLNDIDAVITGTTSNISDYSSDGYIRLTGSSSTPLRARVSNSSVNGYFNRSNTNPNLTVIAKILTQNSNTADDVLVNRDNRYNWMYRHKPSLVTLHGSSEQGSIAVSNTVPNICSARVASNRLLTYNNWTQNTTSTYNNFNYGNTTTDGGTLFASYATTNDCFWKGDFYWIYMSQNTLTDEQVQQVIDYNEEGGGESEYPIYYTEMQDPPDNVTFASMTEAEEYECPWVGMRATIDGDRYVFSGDSISGYEWVYSSSRLPVGYTEVEYVQNTGSSTINTNFYPNTNTRVLCEMEMITTQSYPKLFGAGIWTVNNSLYIEFATSLSVHWIGSTSTYSNYPKSFAFAKHKYDLDKGNLYINDTLVGTKTYSSVVSVSSPLGIFSYINGSTAGNADEHFLGKLYTFKIYDDGTLVREFIPAKRDSDNVGGLYDIVNDVFYTPMESNIPLVAGDPV